MPLPSGTVRARVGSHDPPVLPGTQHQVPAADPHDALGVVLPRPGNVAVVSKEKQWIIVEVDALMTPDDAEKLAARIQNTIGHTCYVADHEYGRMYKGLGLGSMIMDETTKAGARYTRPHGKWWDRLDERNK